ELARLRVAHDDDSRRTVVQRAAVARSDLTVRPECGLQRRELLDRRTGARAVVLAHDRAVGRGDRRDLAVEEAVFLRRDRALLRQRRELVHLLARDLLELAHVLGGLAHRDVHVGQTRGRRPVGLAAFRARLRARARVREPLVLRAGVRRAVDEPAHGLDTTGDEHVALTGLDGVRGHADRLQRRRAVAVDGRAGHLVQTGEQRRDAGDVRACLAGRLSAPPQDVLDEAAVELGDLVEQRRDDERRHVVGPDVDERALVGPADRGAGGGDDDGFGHGLLLEDETRASYLRSRRLRRQAARPRFRSPSGSLASV